MWLGVYFAFINVINLSKAKNWDQSLQSLPNVTLQTPLEDRDVSGLSFTDTISILETHALFSEMLNIKTDISDFKYMEVLNHVLS